MKTFRTKLLKKEQIAEQTWAFYFEKPPGLKYSAGQYGKITLINPLKTDIRGDTRSFSFASAPFEAELMIVMRYRESAFKSVLLSLNPGSEVELLAPLTMMSLKGNNKRPLVFLCGGIGVSAARSIILDALKNGFTQQIFLFNPNRTPERAVFSNEFQNLEKEYKNFSYIPILTGGLNWKNELAKEEGYITSDMILKFCSSPQTAIYYVAGPSKFVWSIYKTLQSMGIKDNSINFDEFTGY